MLQDVRCGAGVGALSPFIADEVLERGELVRVSPQWRIPGRHGVYAVHPHRGLLPRRVQAVIEHLGERLREAQVDWDRMTADPA